MAKAPRAAKRSPAQVAAGKAFASAGRAAQAKKHAKPTKAQHQAALRWAAAGRATLAAKRRGKKAPKAPAVRAAAVPEELTLLPGTWLSNGDTTACAAVAVANHLLAATGIAMTDDEIMIVHELAGGSEHGASIPEVLEVMRDRRWQRAGGRMVRLMSFFPADEDVIMAGLVAGLTLPHAGHAVLTCPDGMITWGRVLPFDGIPEEAWALEWQL